MHKTREESIDSDIDKINIFIMSKVLVLSQIKISKKLLKLNVLFCMSIEVDGGVTTRQ